jgi:hypothetical protein
MKKQRAPKKNADITKAAAPHAPAASTVTPIPEKPQVAAPILAGPVSENVVFDGISMTFKQGTTLDQWETVGMGLAQSSKVSQWCLGDWLNYGTGNFKKEYKAACEKTGLAYGTLRTAASVAKRFAPALRRISVSFEHHRLLAPVKDVKQVLAIMDRVEKDGLSANAMKEIIPKTEKKALTPEQQEAKDVAESTRHREHAQELHLYLRAIMETPAKHKRLAVWGDTLKNFANIAWEKLIATAKRENEKHIAKDPVTPPK